MKAESLWRGVLAGGHKYHRKMEEFTLEHALLSQ